MVRSGELVRETRSGREHGAGLGMALEHRQREGAGRADRGAGLSGPRDQPVEEALAAALSPNGVVGLGVIDDHL